MWRLSAFLGRTEIRINNSILPSLRYHIQRHYASTTHVCAARMLRISENTRRKSSQRVHTFLHSHHQTKCYFSWSKIHNGNMKNWMWKNLLDQVRQNAKCNIWLLPIRNAQQIIFLLIFYNLNIHSAWKNAMNFDARAPSAHVIRPNSLFVLFLKHFSHPWRHTEQTDYWVFWCSKNTREKNVFSVRNAKIKIVARPRSNHSSIYLLASCERSSEQKLSRSGMFMAIRKEI